MLDGLESGRVLLFRVPSKPMLARAARVWRSQQIDCCLQEKQLLGLISPLLGEFFFCSSAGVIGLSAGHAWSRLGKPPWLRAIIWRGLNAFGLEQIT